MLSGDDISTNFLREMGRGKPSPLLQDCYICCVLHANGLEIFSPYMRVY